MDIPVDHLPPVSSAWHQDWMFPLAPWSQHPSIVGPLIVETDYLQNKKIIVSPPPPPQMLDQPHQLQRPGKTDHGSLPLQVEVCIILKPKTNKKKSN